MTAKFTSNLMHGLSCHLNAMTFSNSNSVTHINICLFSYSTPYVAA